MTTETDLLLRQLIAGDPAAAATVRALALSPATTSSGVLVAAALIGPGGGALLARAAASAITARERQLVAIAGAHLGGDEELLDALVRDHLADHPDSILAAWIASQHRTA